MREGKRGKMSDFSFFKGWTVFDEAIACNQKEFVELYLKQLGFQVSGRKLISICAMYGRLWINIFVNCCSGYDYLVGVHTALKYQQYRFVKLLMSDVRISSGFKEYILSKRYKEKSLIGTAIECGDLEALKLIEQFKFHRGIMNFNFNITKIYSLEVDNFAWHDNTAIQFAFIVCNDNFQMLKYLLEKHNPKFQNYNIDALDSKDCQLLYKKVKRVRSWGNRGEYEVTVRDKIACPITFKRDCEGYTIDERIEMCRKNNTLTTEQCQTLSTILQQKRTLFGLSQTV